MNQVVGMLLHGCNCHRHVLSVPLRGRDGRSEFGFGRIPRCRGLMFFGFGFLCFLGLTEICFEKFVSKIQMFQVFRVYEFFGFVLFQVLVVWGFQGFGCFGVWPSLGSNLGGVLSLSPR